MLGESLENCWEISVNIGCLRSALINIGCCETQLVKQLKTIYTLFIMKIYIYYNLPQPLKRQLKTLWISLQGYYYFGKLSEIFRSYLIYAKIPWPLHDFVIVFCLNWCWIAKSKLMKRVTDRVSTDNFFYVTDATINKKTLKLKCIFPPIHISIFWREFDIIIYNL